MVGTTSLGNHLTRRNRYLWKCQKRDLLLHFEVLHVGVCPTVFISRRIGRLAIDLDPAFFQIQYLIIRNPRRRIGSEFNTGIFTVCGVTDFDDDEWFGELFFFSTFGNVEGVKVGIWSVKATQEQRPLHDDPILVCGEPNVQRSILRHAPSMRMCLCRHAENPPLQEFHFPSAKDPRFGHLHAIAGRESNLSGRCNHGGYASRLRVLQCASTFGGSSIRWPE